MAVKPIPDGYHTVTPYLTVRGADELIDFLKQAFGAEEIFRMPGENGAIRHAEIRIGDSMVMLGEARDESSQMPGAIHLYVTDTDSTYQRAIQAGATSLQEPEDQSYGDRSAGVKDSSGNHWWIATHIKDVSFEAMQQG